ncbi:hypothetical protein MARVELLAND_73 [Bacillus phage vB_BspM_MarvelLand]|nr:hypothetical protein MARVELLAND_73 [Bacillus phage vB_BspM_MarvelLand]
MLSWFKKATESTELSRALDKMSCATLGRFGAHLVFVRMAGSDKFLVVKDAKELFVNKIVSKAVVNHMLQQELNVIVLTEKHPSGLYGMEQHEVIAKNWIGGVRNG